MGKIEPMTVILSEEMTAKLRAAVDSGEYANEAEILRAAVQDWSDTHDGRAASLTRLREMIAEGEAGPFRPADEFFDELEEYVAKLVAEQAAPI